MRNMRRRTKLQLKYRKGREHLEDLAVGGRIILKLMLWRGFFVGRAVLNSGICRVAYRRLASGEEFAACGVVGLKYVYFNFLTLVYRSNYGCISVAPELFILIENSVFI
jgi:hypothetical protein